MNVMYEDSIDIDDKTFDYTYEDGEGYTLGISGSGGEPDGTGYTWDDGCGCGDIGGEGFGYK